jgi:hypothetical protein
MSVLLFIVLANFFVVNILPWLAPLVAGGFSGCVLGYGSIRFAHGSLMQRIATIERDVAQQHEDHGQYVTRNEFDLIREDLRDIKTDVREVRRSLTK